MKKKKVTNVDKIENKEEQEEVVEKKKKKNHKESFKHTWKDFKKFINRGNVVDMSIGVVIGSAFGAIVTATTNIFLSIATWGVPGGLSGLITVLPAANEAQAGIDGVGQTFLSSDLSKVAQILVDTGKYTLTEATNLLTSKYTLRGGTYVYNGAAIINWGNLINTILTFIIIALVLFTILKTVAKLNKMRDDAKQKVLEEYYKKHPEERPAPVDPKLPEPTEKDLLKEIVKELKVQNGTYKKPKTVKKK